MPYRELLYESVRVLHGRCSHAVVASYLLYSFGAGKIEVVVPLSLTVADDQQEVLI